MSKLSDDDIRHLVEITDDMAENSEAEGILTPMTMFLFTYWTRRREKQMTALLQVTCHTNQTKVDLKRQKRTMKRREMCRILFLMMKIFIGTV
jgi:hypothetical protein